MKFLLQTLVIFEKENHNDENINMIYKFLTNLDNEILNDYYLTNDVIPFQNNLDLCIRVIDTMIKIFEENEEYEKCGYLKNKKDEAIKIINNNSKKLIL